MKKYSKFLKNTILLLGGGLALLAGLASCENFLKGADVRKDLEEAIEVANSQAVTFNVVVEKGSGTVNLTQIRGKKKDTFELIFEPADDWKFITWEVTDKETGVVVSDIIKFNPADKPQTKCTIQNAKEGLQIHAKCIQIPTIIDVEPKGTSYANAPIVVKFNMPVEAAETGTGETLFNYDNISIKCENDDLIKGEFCCYEAPVFNEDKTELTFVPKSTIKDGIILTKYMSKYNKGVASVNVTFSDAIQIPSGDTLTVIKNPSFQISFVQNVELTPPQKKVLFITRDSSLNMQNAETTFAGEKFHTKNITKKTDDVTDDEYKALVLQNASNGTFYIYGRYVDDGSGVKSVVVEENLKKDFYTGRNLSDNPLSVTYTQNSNPDTAIFINNGSETSFFIKHTCVSDNGLILLNVKVCDNCYNFIQEEYFIVKKGFINTSDCSIGCNYDNLTYYIECALTDYESSAFTLYNNSKEIINMSKDSIKIEFLYYTIQNELKRITVPAFTDYDTYYYTIGVLTDLGFVPNTSLKVIYTDVLGNILEQNLRVFPSKDMKLLYSMNKQSNYADIKYYHTDGREFSSKDRLYVQLLRKNKTTQQEEIQSSGSDKIYPGYTYKIIINSITLDNYVIDFDTIDEQTLAPVVITNVDIKRSTEKGKLTVTMDIADDSWNYYDAIYVKNFAPFLPDTTKVIFDIDSYRCFTGDYYLYVYGLKNNKRSDENSEESQYKITRKNGNDENDYYYDTKPPAYNSSQEDWIDACGDYIEYFFKDSETGAADSFIRVINAKFGIDEIYNLNEENNYSCKIPNYILAPARYSPSSMCITLFDKAGNQYYKEYNVQDDGIYPLNEMEILDDNDSQLIIGCRAYSAPEDFYVYEFKEDENENISKTKGFDKIFDYSKVENTNIITAWNWNSSTDYTNEQRLTIDKASLNVINNGSVCDSFLCFLIYAGAGWGSLYGPIYYYNGTPCSDKNDYLMPNGRGNKSFVVGSEGPVFIHTVVTTAPLEECCDWDYSEWEYYKEEYKQEILEISPDCRSLVYSVPLDKIDPGKCYVVIAHYSNNNVIMSDVMVR